MDPYDYEFFLTLLKKTLFLSNIIIKYHPKTQLLGKKFRRLPCAHEDAVEWQKLPFGFKIEHAAPHMIHICAPVLSRLEYSPYDQAILILSGYNYYKTATYRSDKIISTLILAVGYCFKRLLSRNPEGPVNDLEVVFVEKLSRRFEVPFNLVVEISAILRMTIDAYRPIDKELLLMAEEVGWESLKLLNLKVYKSMFRTTRLVYLRVLWTLLSLCRKNPYCLEGLYRKFIHTNTKEGFVELFDSPIFRFYLQAGVI